LKIPKTSQRPNPNPVELGRTVENTLRPNTKKGITKEQHITQSLLYRWNCRLLKNTLRPNTKKGITKSSTSLNLLS
jgi:hypothetical protein